MPCLKSKNKINTIKATKRKSGNKSLQSPKRISNNNNKVLFNENNKWTNILYITTFLYFLLGFLANFIQFLNIFSIFDHQEMNCQLIIAV